MNDQINQWIAELEEREAKLATVELKLKKAVVTSSYWVFYEGHQIARVNKGSDDGWTYWQVVVWDKDGEAWNLTADDYRRVALTALKDRILEGGSFELVAPVLSGLPSKWKYTGGRSGVASLRY